MQCMAVTPSDFPAISCVTMGTVISPERCCVKERRHVYISPNRSVYPLPLTPPFSLRSISGADLWAQRQTTHQHDTLGCALTCTKADARRECTPAEAALFIILWRCTIDIAFMCRLISPHVRAPLWLWGKQRKKLGWAANSTSCGFITSIWSCMFATTASKVFLQEKCATAGAMNHQWHEHNPLFFSPKKKLCFYICLILKGPLLDAFHFLHPSRAQVLGRCNAAM